MRRFAIVVSMLVAAPAFAGPPAAPASASVASAKGITPPPANKIKRGPIKLFGPKGKPHRALNPRVKIDPAMLKHAVKLHQRRVRAQKTSADGRFRQVGKYWVKTRPTLDPTRATVTEWVQLVRGALRTARVAPPKAEAPAQP